MSLNYSWFFFRRTLNDDSYEDIYRFLNILLDEYVVIIGKSISQYDFDKYQIERKIKSKIESVTSYTEFGINIIKTMDKFAYKYPVLRVLIGENNILLYINKINKFTFPNLSNGHIFHDVLGKFSEKFAQNLTDTFNMNISRDFLKISGLHNCYLNCGECCDGADRTKSPLEGGMYCKALTNVGQLCLYQLSNVQYPPENEICLEFFCGDVQSSKDINIDGLGCKLRKFCPKYSDQDMLEFFKIQDLIQQKKLNTALNKSERADEVETYWSSIKFIVEFFKKKEIEDVIFHKKFLYSLGTYNFENCLKLLSNLDQTGLDFIESSELQILESTIKDLKKWRNIFITRKIKYSDCIEIDA